VNLNDNIVLESKTLINVEDSGKQLQNQQRMSRQLNF